MHWRKTKKKRKEPATKASKRQHHSSPCVLQLLFRTHDSTQAFHLLTSHGLFTWWKHNHSGLSIETRVKNLPADLTAFLAKCTRMAKNMRHEVTSRLHMFPLHLILYAATAATTWSVHRLKASLFSETKDEVTRCDAKETLVVHMPKTRDTRVPMRQDLSLHGSYKTQKVVHNQEDIQRKGVDRVSS